MSLQLLTTDPQLRIVGKPITAWRSLQAIPRFNEVGTGEVILPVTGQLLDQVQDGNRMVLLRHGSIFLAGPIEHVAIEWDGVGDTAAGGIARVQWASDLASIADRITYPDPTRPATEQAGDKRVFTDVNAETILRTLVNENAGPAALLSRRVPRLVLGPVAGVGSSVSYSTRFQPLADELRAIALLGGGLGFRAVQIDDRIEFQVYQPDDLSHTVRFSPLWGNLSSYSFDRGAPLVTTAIVGSQDADDEWVIRERTNAAAEAAWGRRERYLDRRGYEDLDELDGAGDEVLADGGETARLATVTIDTPKLRFGEHYHLGDVGAVALPGIESATDVVRAVYLQHSPTSGEVVTVMVGNQAASSDPQWIEESRRLARQLARVATS